MADLSDFEFLPQEMFNPLVFDIIGGPAPLIGACAILSYMCFRTIREQNPDFTVSQIQEAIRIPEDTVLQHFNQNTAPEGWNDGLLGDFRACTLIRMKCPPSHKMSETIKCM